MNKDSGAGPGVIGYALMIPVAVLLSPLIALYHGWAAAIIWGWFAVPLGAPVITAVQCGGLLLVVNAMSLPKLRSAKGGEGVFWSETVFAPPLAICGAWIFKALFL